jgi:hypothetical protein
MRQYTPVSEAPMERKQRTVAMRALRWKNPISKIEAKVNRGLIRKAIRNRARVRFFALMLWPRVLEVLAICAAIYWVRALPGMTSIAWWMAKIAGLGYAALKLAYQIWRAKTRWRRFEAMH